jgi:hypothetical protein
LGFAEREAVTPYPRPFADDWMRAWNAHHVEAVLAAPAAGKAFPRLIRRADQSCPSTLLRSKVVIRGRIEVVDSAVLLVAKDLADTLI